MRRAEGKETTFKVGVTMTNRTAYWSYGRRGVLGVCAFVVVLVDAFISPVGGLVHRRVCHLLSPASAAFFYYF